MSRILIIAVGALAMTSVALGDSFIVEDGAPLAEIIIAEDAPRMTRLAAREFQTYVEKIAEAKLRIGSAPSDEFPVKIYIGQSPATRELGITSEGLEFGAYRMVSGEDWLVLLGDDTDWRPPEPWARSNTDWLENKQSEWDELTGAKWSNPLAAGMYRHYSGNAWHFETEAQEADGEIHIWEFDQRGSLNAVYAWLRELGVRWYMPGDLGEIVPKQSSVRLRQMNRTVRPDFEIRTMHLAQYHSRSRPDILWSLRLGVNDIPSILHHGIRYVTEREEQRTEHPDYFTLINGQRDTTSPTANACLSSPELLQENVRFVRTIFDLYNAPVVSVMPHDGFNQICECALCDGKATLDRGYSGWYSDYVWEYVNRVAREVAKTHPDRKLLCGAYSTYRFPPEKIDKLEPNVLVQITNGRPRWEMDEETHNQLERLRDEWQQRTANPLSLTMNYPFTQRGEFRPCYFPHVIARGLRDTQGQVWRQDIWGPIERGVLHRPGVNHLNAWIHARFMWDVEQDVDELLSEYCRLFYGPAGEHMQMFIEYCEANFDKLTKQPETVNRALSLFETAKAAVESETVYAQRLALVDDYLEELRKRKDQLNRPRDDVPVFSAYDLTRDKWKEAKAGFKLDGKLDESFWVLQAGMKELINGRNPAFGSTFQVVWDGDAIYFGIRCEDVEGAPANVSTTESGKPAIWNGDHLEILLETDEHAYYQIVVNPAGAVTGLDRGAPQQEWFSWSPEAEVGAHIGDDFWSVEVRIPVTQSTDDPLHLVVGRKPMQDLPWHFNVCRKRIRETGTEVSAYSPTGANTFHDASKFAKLYVR